MFKIIGFGFGVAIICNFMKSAGMELSHIVRIVGNTILLLFIATQMTPIITLLRDLSFRAHIPIDMFTIILKTIGLAYLGQFGSTLCADVGEGGIGKYIDSATKISILLVGLPVFLGILELITDLLR